MQTTLLRQASAIVVSKHVTTAVAFRFVTMKPGTPDLVHFTQPIALTRLNLFLMAAFRVRQPRPLCARRWPSEAGTL